MKTDRKTKAEKSPPKGKHLLAAYEHIPVGIVEVSLDGKYMDVNQEFCRILGYPRKELLQLGIKDGTHEDDYGLDLRLYEQLITGKIPFYRLEKRFVRKGGGVIWAELTRSLACDEKGQPLSTVGVVLDISDRKDVESVLRESVERLRLATGAAQMFMWEWDFQNNSYTVADNFEQVIGFSTGLLSKNNFETLQRLVPAEDSQRITEAYEKAIENQSDLHALLCRLIHPENGQLAWLEISAKIVYDPEGKPERMFGVGQNVTANKRMEDTLRESEERFRNLANAMPSVVWTAAPDGTITYANDQWFHYTSITPEENAKGWPALVLHPDDYERCIREWTRALETVPDEYRIEVRNRRYDGQYRWFQTRAVPARDPSGKALAWYGVTTDIHERIEAEQRLTLLAEVSEMLRNVDDPNELMYDISRIVGEHLNVKRALFNEIDLEHDREIIHRDYHKGYDSVAGTHKVSAYSSVTSAEVAAGRTVINHDSKTDPRTAQDYEKTYALSGERSYVVVPMMRENRWVASLWVSDDMPRRWTSEETSLLETIAERTWTAVERARAEKALAKSEEKYRTLFNSMDEGYCVIEFFDGPHGRLSDYVHVEANPAYTANAGIPDIVGQKVREMVPDEAEGWVEIYRNVLITGEPVRFERELVATGRYLELAAFRIEPEERRQVAVLFKDITERKRAEEALRRNEQMFFKMVAAAPFGVYFIDSEFRLRAVNKGSEAVFSNIDPLIGRDFAEILRLIWQEPFATEAIERFRHTLRTGESFISPTIIEERANIEEIQAYDWQIHRITLADGAYGVVCYFYDLSAQKKMEATVRASESLYRAIARSIPDGGIYVVDKNFRYLVAEGPVTEAFGLSREKLEGRTVMEAFSDERGKRMEARLRRTFAGESIDFETEHQGRIYWTQQAPLSDSIGQAIILTLDITERKQAEEALRESEERFRAILRQATAGIVRKDMEGRFIFVNQAFCNMLGYPESDLLGRTVWSFMHPDDVVANKQSFDRLMLEGVPFNFERRLLRADGSVIWVDASVSPIMDSAGKPQSAVAVEVDITRRKQAEEALQQLNLQLEERVLSRTARLRAVNQTLREEIAERQRVEEALRQSETLARANEEKLSTLFDLLPVGISFLDLEGQIIQMNPALTNIMRLSKDQVLEQAHPSRKYIRANGTLMTPAEFASRRALTERKTVYNVETGAILEDGGVVWTSVSAAPVNVADVGAVVVTADITESKRAERALQESRERLQILSQRLVEVQEEERRAIARELHDRVGQTLAALNINLIIISDQLGDKVDEQTSTRLNDSMELVAETIALVRDVMSNLRPSVLDDYGLEAAIESHLNQFTSRYEISVRFEKPEQPIPRLGPSIEMTFLRIAQEALMNIAKHAQASQVILSLQRQEGAVCLTIQDNGMGITSWQEANRPGSHGLTIMRERAEAFGGNLAVRSVPGDGTKIQVKIPVESNDLAQAGKEQSQ